MRLDDKVGSIETGKLANFVVFNEDIFDIAHKSPEKFGELDPWGTFFEGEERHVISTMRKNR